MYLIQTGMCCCYAVNFLILPVNWRVDDGDVTTDYCAVFKGVNIGGIDRQSVRQVSCAKSITHCKQIRKQTSVRKQFQTYKCSNYFGNKGIQIFLVKWGIRLSQMFTTLLQPSEIWTVIQGNGVFHLVAYQWSNIPFIL